MTHLKISVEFLDHYFHGRKSDLEPEWPPSPLRLMQAIVCANSDKVGFDADFDRTMLWIEQQSPPVIIAPEFKEVTSYALSVPNNDMDAFVYSTWFEGKIFNLNTFRKEENPATHRTMKNFCPIYMDGESKVHYIWKIKNPTDPNVKESIEKLIDYAREIAILGQGTDCVVVNAEQITSKDIYNIKGECWQPCSTKQINKLRIPKMGTLDALKRRHKEKMEQIDNNVINTPFPLTKFDIVGYKRSTDLVGRPHIVFSLRHNDNFYRYSQKELIHIAGMVRHLTGKLVKQREYSPPKNVINGKNREEWIKSYIYGHQEENPSNCIQERLSYIPLPSIGHKHADGDVRRIMIAAPFGHEKILEFLADELDGKQLKPEENTKNLFGEDGPPILHKENSDNMVSHYVKKSKTWATVTPIVLPGQYVKNDSVMRKLIIKALRQSGLDQECNFRWSSFPLHEKSLPANMFDKNGRHIGYLRPKHLADKIAVHLILEFEEEVVGPIFAGLGRHYGLGVLAPLNE
mgnify:CR=1 FL=1